MSRSPRATFEFAILAGGLSTRMGLDKARLRLNRRSMLSRIRSTAHELGWPIRVIRRDAVTRCGPLGGIVTALKTRRANAVIFLACDMPLISTALLNRLMQESQAGTCAVFSVQRERAGFPFVLPESALPIVEAQIARKVFSIQALAALLRARKLRVPLTNHDLFNVNTPEDRTEAERLLRERQAPRGRK